MAGDKISEMEDPFKGFSHATLQQVKELEDTREKLNATK